jgi:DNA-binding NarL/FixJ family response regulator
MNSLTPIPTMYNILVADDHPLFRDAISGVIRCQFVNSSVLEAEDLDSAMTIAQQNLDLDMILLDLNMPGMDGLNGLIQLRTHAPSIPVVIVSAEHDKNVVLKSITYGAVGFIVKSLARSAMTEALEQVLSGQVYLPADVFWDTNTSPTHRSRFEHGSNTDCFQSLTRRQLIVLEQMAKGESNKQIAFTLHIAETTVKAHVSAVLRKLNVHNRIQAIMTARDIDFHEYLKR